MCGGGGGGGGRRDGARKTKTPHGKLGKNISQLQCVLAALTWIEAWRYLAFLQPSTHHGHLCGLQHLHRRLVLLKFLRRIAGNPEGGLSMPIFPADEETHLPNDLPNV